MPVRVLAADRLTGERSAKDVRHVAIDLSPSGLTYEPGDSIGIDAPNDPALVDSCLQRMGAAGHELVPCPDGTMRTVREAFAWQVDIARPLDRTTELLAMAPTDPATPPRCAAWPTATTARAGGRRPAGPAGGVPLRAPAAVRPGALAARAEAAAVFDRVVASGEPGQVHLCVGVVRAERRGRVRHGIASAFLAHRAAVHGQILANIQPSHFRLPADPATPVIMVRPRHRHRPVPRLPAGTRAAGHAGKTWLFFGDQHEATDFLFATS